MPVRLRPTAPIAADAVLVGDPGRALLLAQELLGEPKMSNHARGLWGYTGQTPGGMALTIQATGMGGPSAALVLADLAELGVRRAVRVGTCATLGGGPPLGELLLVTAAIAGGGSASALGADTGETVNPDAVLTERLRADLREDDRAGTLVSFDTLPNDQAFPADALAADMQTAPLLARARALKVSVAAVLVAAEDAGGERLEQESLKSAEVRAGQAALAALSP